MGLIATVTPGGRENVCIVPRKQVSNNDILRTGMIEIYHYKYTKGKSPLLFCDLEQIRQLKEVPLQKPMEDILWNLSPFIQWPHPGWSGFSQMVYKGNHPGKSNVVFLPMIDMYPSDMTCIY